ncbi:hypothetical protein P3X46_004479 [Hevea brasiliensis]|uniref:Methylenetetrahydrofolate reductase (NAD(P)H) n=1 Tax=Hevea brasiliensis TaxID=3981 RepID=A0ABQ9MZR9_HEVBR|nr:hypothetical protein P3X46_004479 [Hevea brasiliensis]
MRPKIYLLGGSITKEGCSGYNIRWALKVAERVFLPMESKEYGANDACLLDRCSAFLHVPLTKYKHNLHPNTVVLFITPPIDEAARPGIFMKNEAASAYAKTCIAIAEELGVLDGLHLTQSGNKIAFEEVVMKLKEQGLSAKTLPVDLPLIADIDPKDPLKACQKKIIAFHF